MNNTPPAAAEKARGPAPPKAAGGVSSSLPELNLLLEWPRADRTNRWRVSLGISICLHLLVFAFGTRVASFVHSQPEKPLIVALKVTPLYLPPDLLTQKAPNHGKVTKQIDLADLVAPQRAQQRVVAPAPGKLRHLETPSTKPEPHPKQAPPLITPEAPKVNAAEQSPVLPQGAPDGLVAQAPPAPAPPQIPVASSGIAEPKPDRPRKLAVPKNSVQDVIRSLAHDSTGSRLQISDENNQPKTALPGHDPSAGRMSSGLELQSDPQGADFRPYLTQILTIVKRNWFSVLPESARLGILRGHTILQFVVNQDGSIPKLVIVSPSGLQPLDRAAVAGLSMSNPLPPLPREFKGPSIRLQFSFNYNLPSM